MPMVSMKMAPKKQEPMEEPMAQPEYEHGLRIYLSDEALKKLGIMELPDVGSKMMLHALVEVVSVSQNATMLGEKKSMDLQITDMGFGKAEKQIGPENMYDKEGREAENRPIAVPAFLQY